MTDKPLAEKAATWEREVGTDPRDDVNLVPPTPKVVPEDTYITRPDLGDDTYTLVAKGDRVPAGLEANKRRPARKG
jgi:hypothetical protein